MDIDKGSLLRLLCLDKDLQRHQLFKKALEPTSYAIHHIASSQAVFDQLDSNSFDLIAVSHDPNGIDVFQIIETIQQSPTAPSILILVEPGNEAVAAKALEIGASNYIVFDENEAWLTMLPIVIRQMMRRHQLEIEKREMLFVLQDRNRALSYLNLVGADLTSILDLDQVMTRLMRYAIEILGTEGSSIWLWTDDDQTHLECHAVSHRTATPPLKGVRVASGEGIVGWAGKNNRSTILNQVSTDDRFAKDIDSKINFNTLSLLAVPLKVHGNVFGVLEFVNKLKGNFDERDQSLAETLAYSAATAIENARLVESLRQSKSILQERNAELDAFGHTVAHDLQNMLARIVGFSEYLQQEIESFDGNAIPRETVSHSADIIAKDSRKMSVVIEALMLLSAIREAEVEVAPMNTQYLINETLERLDHRVRATEATISYPDSWPVALAFAPWVEEVWYNYLGNALKYGGNPPQIELGATLISSTGEIQFWIKDNGPGVSEALKPELFRPFTDYGRNRKMGAGLGLSIVQRIIKRLDGTVGVDSEPGQGSCFWFTLPAYIEPTTDSSKESVVDQESHLLTS
ncbi:MAG: ATP-binding protein [Anaerolineae bacterium]